ncbi:hypothetical protein MNV49_005619 [Pseudohyphozyma bogoriensis]|nr:hypothetical protein MNV49_005619 [Pseudohyphozyma bogoriensis]
MPVATADLDANLSSEKLPFVDIGPYLDPNSTPDQRKESARQLDSACRDFGFFYCKGHGIPAKQMSELLAFGHALFELEQEKKDEMAIWKSQDRARGYQKLGENVTYAKRDQQEGFDIYPEPANPSSDPLNGTQMWPSDEVLPGFKDACETYVKTMIPIGKAFMRCMAEGLGQNVEVFDELQKDPYWVLRVVGYPPLESDPEGGVETDKGISCGAHTDYGCLTFLLQDDIPGSLQVEAKDGSWIPADAVPGSLVVNIGDIINVLTNETYKGTMHRVIHRGDRYRVSMPFFFEPSQYAVLKPLPQFVTPEKPAVVESIAYFEHLKGMVRDASCQQGG